MLKKLLHTLNLALMAKRKRNPQPSTLNLQPVDTELEQVVDEARRDVGKGPAERSPQEGIRDMQARIAYHTTLIAKLRQQATLNPQPSPRGIGTGIPRGETLNDLIAASERQLTEARNRLTEYQTQLAVGLN
jgi:hypothetical protein